MFGFGSVLSGAQTTMHDWRMGLQLLRLLRNWAVIIALAAVLWSAWGAWRDEPQQVKAALFYLRAVTIGAVLPDDTVWRFTHADGRPGRVTIAGIRRNPAFKAAFDAMTSRLITAALTGGGGALGAVLLLVIIFRIRGRRMHRTVWKRGAHTAPPERLDALTRRTHRRLPWLTARLPAGLPLPPRRGARFALAGVTWPRGGEMRHTLIVGTTGTGKTVAMSALLDQIRASGGTALVYDKLGSYIPHFYRHGRDVILNPLDARSRDWDLFAEARHEQDFSMIADALIPAFKDTADPFWTTAARQLFASGAAALWKRGHRSVPALVDLLLKTDLKEMAAAMEGMVEQSIIDPANPKTALSVRAILGTAVKPLTWMPPPRNPFSIRDWVEGASDSVLFLSSDAPSHPSRRAMIATQIEIALIATLSSRRRAGGRMWFIIDELPTLERIPSLTSGLRESRQFGGCFVIGTQVVSELREIYGRNEAETISGNCNTRLILASPDMATAEWCANALGRSMAERTVEGRSFGASEVRDGVNISKREDIRNVILPSEIMELPKLTGWLRMGAGLPVAAVSLAPRNRPVIAPHLVPAERIDRLTGEVYEDGGNGVGSVDMAADNALGPHDRAPDMGMADMGMHGGPGPDVDVGADTPSLPGNPEAGPKTGMEAGMDVGMDVGGNAPLVAAPDPDGPNPDGPNLGVPDPGVADWHRPADTGMARGACHRVDPGVDPAGVDPATMARVAARLGVQGDVAGDTIPPGHTADATRSESAMPSNAGTPDHWRGAPLPSGPPPEGPAADGPAPHDGGWPEGEGPAGPVPGWMAQIPPAAHDGRRDGPGRARGKDVRQPGFFDGTGDGDVAGDTGVADVRNAGDPRNMPGTDMPRTSEGGAPDADMTGAAPLPGPHPDGSGGHGPASPSPVTRTADGDGSDADIGRKGAGETGAVTSGTNGPESDTDVEEVAPLADPRQAERLGPEADADTGDHAPAPGVGPPGSDTPSDSGDTDRTGAAGGGATTDRPSASPPASPPGNSRSERPDHRAAASREPMGRPEHRVPDEGDGRRDSNWGTHDDI